MINTGLILLMTGYWLWRCRDILIKNDKKISWNDAVYWLLAASGIIMFYVMLMTIPWIVLITQFVIGVFIMMNVKKMDFNWFMGLFYFTLFGSVSMIMSLLLGHHDIEYAKHM